MNKKSLFRILGILFVLLYKWEPLFLLENEILLCFQLWADKCEHSTKAIVSPKIFRGTRLYWSILSPWILGHLNHHQDQESFSALFWLVILELQACSSCLDMREWLKWLLNRIQDFELFCWTSRLCISLQSENHFNIDCVAFYGLAHRSVSDLFRFWVIRVNQGFDDVDRMIFPFFLFCSFLFLFRTIKRNSFPYLSCFPPIHYRVNHHTSQNKNQRLHNIRIKMIVIIRFFIWFVFME